MEEKVDKEKKKKHGFFSFLKRKAKDKSKEVKDASKDKKGDTKDPKRRSVMVTDKKEQQRLDRMSIATPVNINALMKNLPDWQESTRKVIKDGKLETFPIAGDLPRLLNHLSIVREVSEGNYDTLFPDESAEKTQAPKAGDCFQVIKCICTLFEGDEQCAKIEQEWNSTMANDEDMSVQKTFLIRILTKVFLEDGQQKDVSPVITFLKAINQKIIANSTLHLKMVCGSLLFKDSHPMFWEVACILQDKTYLIHYRKQESTSKKEDEYFQFMWELRLVFSSGLTQLEEVTMGISSIEFRPETRKDVRDNVLDTLKPILFTDVEIKDVLASE
ncbi:hypothetical protein EIN_020730 [Entamoeba invadens IP1]|uniref:hypothetical protein n=1 Tax=Entamoeba invadens IP1 TaxID=370355 RepID=UPI0002C3E382|nr:hypothetical protein EIN_020730 [Entamoeba invadens IP1]ELP90594.1 hypothetical protein EIN_020730 [Entamoeba invadens IP1]|eukprot:XP_004257365.1 hypothetical protein EIN_020730 [Entamoeba invadens IP1]